MTQETLSVPEVHCDHCVHSIEGAVGALEGVDTVKVDLGAKSVTVSFDNGSVDKQKIVAAIESQGYDVTDGGPSVIKFGRPEDKGA
ncbi:MAG: heavy-metal-associated domain-containing protein [Actinomycetota bacterium]|nr:copper ion binding protein [Actinomycetota bacterium]